MKKLLLLSAVLIGTASASQAGVRVSVGIGLPVPPLPNVVIGAPAPVYVAPPAVVYGAPVFYPRFGPGCYGYPAYGYRGLNYGYGYRGHSYYRGGRYCW